MTVGDDRDRAIERRQREETGRDREKERYDTEKERQKIERIQRKMLGRREREREILYLNERLRVNEIGVR